MTQIIVIPPTGLKQYKKYFIVAKYSICGLFWAEGRVQMKF